MESGLVIWMNYAQNQIFKKTQFGDSLRKMGLTTQKMRTQLGRYLRNCIVHRIDDVILIRRRQNCSVFRYMVIHLLLSNGYL